MLETLLELDSQLLLKINSAWQHPWLDVVMPWLRNKYFWIPLYAVLLAFLITRYKKQSLGIIVFCILAIALSDQLSSALLKPWIGRLRPCHTPELASQLRMIVSCGGKFGFVSSHAANHFAMAIYFGAVFSKWRRPIMLFAGLWAASIAYAQVYVAVHFPGDVVAGALLGCSVGCLSAWLGPKLIPQYFPKGI